MPPLEAYESPQGKTLSMLDATLENSKKQLADLRRKLADNPKELAKEERNFMFKECAKLEIISDLQAKLDEYRKAQSALDPVDRAESAESTASSEDLGKYLRASGQFRYTSKWQAHHIICSKHASHGVARFKLFAYLGINDPHNGCWLPSKHKYATGTVLPRAVGHAYLHTGAYAKWIRRKVITANGKNDLINRLREVRLTLHNATKDLPDILTDKGKQDLRTHS